MNRYEQTELTVLCLIYKDNQILLQNRVKADWHGYTLPGGHVERNESIVDAVKREMKEETGLTIFSPELRGVKQFPIDGGRYLVFLFRTNEFEGELISSSEGKMEWFDRSSLDQLNTVKDFSELLAVIDSDRLTEFLYVPNGNQWDVLLK